MITDVVCNQNRATHLRPVHRLNRTTRFAIIADEVFIQTFRLQVPLGIPFSVLFNVNADVGGVGSAELNLPFLVPLIIGKRQFDVPIKESVTFHAELLADPDTKTFRRNSLMTQTATSVDFDFVPVTSEPQPNLFSYRKDQLELEFAMGFQAAIMCHGAFDVEII